jgi:hypothetical protein
VEQDHAGEAKDRRILQIEQQLANVKAENEELR